LITCENVISREALLINVLLCI